MSRPALEVPTTASQTRTRPATTPTGSTSDFEGVAIVFAQMTREERLRAYETGVFTLRELNAAAGLRPDLMPLVNGELEWIALTMADLD